MPHSIISRRIALALAGLLVLAGCDKIQKPSFFGSDEPVVQQEQEQPQSAENTERHFILNIGDRVYFAVDQSTLSDPARQTLLRQAQWLRQYPAVTVRIEGHADERGTREYNIALSARRAAAVREFLAAQGVPAERIDVIAYGKERPVALCDAETCYTQNRRAVTVITGGAASG